MNYKIFLYAFDILLSMYALSAVNFNYIIKKDKKIEVRILVLILGLVLGYLLTKFILEFLEISKLF